MLTFIVYLVEQAVAGVKVLLHECHWSFEITLLSDILKPFGYRLITLVLCPTIVSGSPVSRRRRFTLAYLESIHADPALIDKLYELIVHGSRLDDMLPVRS